jgi:hypothetical protein
MELLVTQEVLILVPEGVTEAMEVMAEEVLLATQVMVV